MRLDISVWLRRRPSLTNINCRLSRHNKAKGVVMRRFLFGFAVFVLLLGTGVADAQVIHHASLGGADVCEAFGLPPGCDANFSLAANLHAVRRPRLGSLR